jgi:hypothetical protein
MERRGVKIEKPHGCGRASLMPFPKGGSGRNERELMDEASKAGKIETVDRRLTTLPMPLMIEHEDMCGPLEMNRNPVANWNVDAL